jgi:hypothetical protein
LGRTSVPLEPALRAAVEIATGVGNTRSVVTIRPVDGRWITAKSVQIDNAGERVAAGVEDAQGVIHRLHHVTIAGAQTLVGRLEGKLVAAIDQTLVAVVETVKR